MSTSPKNPTSDQERSALESKLSAWGVSSEKIPAAADKMIRAQSQIRALCNAEWCEIVALPSPNGVLVVTFSTPEPPPRRIRDLVTSISRDALSAIVD